MYTPSNAELYGAGLNNDEVEGFLASMRRPDVTDNNRLAPPENLSGVREVRFRNGAAIAIRWRLMFSAATRRERQTRDLDCRQTGLSFITAGREPRIRPAAFLPAAIGPGARP